jgi:predicted PurR-regulated permease PerM
MDELPPYRSKKPLWNRLNIKRLIHFLLIFASGWATIVILDYFKEVFFVFTIAAILAFLLGYPVRYLEKFLGRGIALGIVISASLIVVIALLAGLGLAVFNQLQQLISSLDQSLSSSGDLLLQLQNFLNKRKINIDLQPLSEMLSNGISAGVGFVVGTLSVLPNTFISLVIIMVIAFFMLIDGEKLWRLGLKLVPEEERDRVSDVVKRSFMGFFQGQLLLCICLSIFSFIAFSVLKVPFALALAIIVGIFDAIPGIGATLGGIIVTLITLIQGGWTLAIEVVLVSVLLQQLQDNFVAPKVMQNSVHLNPVIVFFALMVGAKIAGLLGVFLSVPIASAIVSLLEIEEMRS